MRPFRWPAPADGAPRERFFAEGGFFTPDRRARAVPTPPNAAAPRDPARPFTLNAGRVRDHWPTMTRTGFSARLSAMSPSRSSRSTRPTRRYSALRRWSGRRRR
ncbi:MAG: hypothetical protein ACFCUS_01795 [Rubrimonas sp.]